MLNVHVVTEFNRSEYIREIHDYHSLRHLVYVEERGWTDLARPDGLEIDQFDTDAAIHLIAIDGDEVVGGSRLLPMDHPSLLSTVFPDLSEIEPVPTDPQTLEWTRMFVTPSRRTGVRNRSVAGAILASVMEYAVTVGARRVGGVQETFWLPRWAEFGWRVVPTGLPRDIEGAMTLCAWMETSAAALDGVREVTGWGPILVWNKRDVQIPRRIA